jgi:hypothetical protein
MKAGLVAAVADIDLQCVELGPRECGKRNAFEQRQGIAHDPILISAIELATRQAGASSGADTISRQFGVTGL